MAKQHISKRLSNLTEGELQWAVYKKIYQPKDRQSNLFVDWLDNKRLQIKSIFGDKDRLYIKPKTPEFAQELTIYVVKNNIGAYYEWIKSSDTDGWWLLIYGANEEQGLFDF